MTPEQKLKKIANAFETIRKDGKFSVSTHAYYNLEGAILDIERTGECDKRSLRTLKRVHSQLGKIGEILDL